MPGKPLSGRIRPESGFAAHLSPAPSTSSARAGRRRLRVRRPAFRSARAVQVRARRAVRRGALGRGTPVQSRQHVTRTATSNVRPAARRSAAGPPRTGAPCAPAPRPARPRSRARWTLVVQRQDRRRAADAVGDDVPQRRRAGGGDDRVEHWPEDGDSAGGDPSMDPRAAASRGSAAPSRNPSSCRWISRSADVERLSGQRERGHDPAQHRGAELLGHPQPGRGVAGGTPRRDVGVRESRPTRARRLPHLHAERGGMPGDRAVEGGAQLVERRHP